MLKKSVKNYSPKKVIKASKNSPEAFSFFSALQNLLQELPERSREIIKNRFGLGKIKPQTLEKTGQIFGITRERVRQIITDAIRKISQKKNHPDFSRVQNLLFFTIEKNSGIMKKSDILEKFGQGKEIEINTMDFFSNCFPGKLFFESEEIESAWVLDQAILEKVEQVRIWAEKIFAEEQKPLPEKTLIEKIAKKLPTNSLASKEILNFLQVLKKIKPNKFGKWGLADWKEISPRGTREKIYAILQEGGQPLHFSQIAKLIDRFGLGKRKAHPQTIHNELIKNEQFVLIGRGIYALKEWGYCDGTVQEVLKKILEASPQPLSREEVLKEIFKVRQVKKATVLINLNNENFFVKENNYYRLK